MSFSPQVLVLLGGSCFMGRSIVLEFLQQNQKAERQASPSDAAPPSLPLVSPETPLPWSQDALQANNTPRPRLIVVCNRGTSYWGESLPYICRQYAISAQDALQFKETTTSTPSTVTNFCFFQYDRTSTSETRQMTKFLIQLRMPLFFTDFSCDGGGCMHRIWQGLHRANKAEVHGEVESPPSLSGGRVGNSLNSSISSNSSSSSDSSSEGSSCSSSMSIESSLDDVPAVTFDPPACVVGYVLISSDSVYEDSQPVGSSNQGLEEHVAVCVDPKLRTQRKKPRSYAIEKRQGELVLLKYFRTGTIFRLPDVLGPFDDSGRFWATVMWSQQALQNQNSNTVLPDLPGHQVPLLFPEEHVSTQVSVVFSLDVVRLILKEFQGNYAPNSCDNIFHVASPTVSLFELVESIASSTWSHCGSQESWSSSRVTLLPKSTRNQPSMDFYPSVECGPVSLQRVLARYPGWQPTSVKSLVDFSCNFFLKYIPRMEEEGTARGMVDVCNRFSAGGEKRHAEKKLPKMIRTRLTNQ